MVLINVTPNKLNLKKILSQFKKANESDKKFLNFLNDTKRLSQKMPLFLIYKNVLLCHLTNAD